MKDAIMNDIHTRLSAMGILFASSQDADIEIAQNFYADNRPGKTISLRASVFLQERERTILYWECSGPLENGLINTARSVPIVKTTLYATDGNAYEYIVNLRNITNTIKAVAQQYGWKFCMVPSREKASAVTSAPSQIRPVRAGALFYVLLGLFVVATVFFFAVGQVSMIGWAVGVLLFALVLLFGTKIAAKSLILNLVMWVLMGGALLITLGLTAPGKETSASGLIQKIASKASAGELLPDEDIPALSEQEANMPTDEKSTIYLLKNALWDMIEATRSTELVLADDSSVSYEDWKAEAERSKELWKNVYQKASAVEKSLGNDLFAYSSNLILQKNLDAAVLFALSLFETTAYATPDNWTYEEVRNVWDSGRNLEHVRTLAKYLKTDAKTAYSIHEMALSDLNASNWNDSAKKIETLEKAAKTISTTSKLTVFAGMTYASAGTLTPIMKAAVVVTGVDLAFEVTETGANVYLGDDANQTVVVGAVQNARKFTAPASAVAGLVTLNVTDTSVKGFFETAKTIVETGNEYASEGKVLGIKIRNDNAGTTGLRTAKVAGNDIPIFLEKNGVSRGFLNSSIPPREWKDSSETARELFNSSLGRNASDTSQPVVDLGTYFDGKWNAQSNIVSKAYTTGEGIEIGTAPPVSVETVLEMKQKDGKIAFASDITSSPFNYPADVLGRGVYYSINIDNSGAFTTTFGPSGSFLLMDLKSCTMTGEIINENEWGASIVSIYEIADSKGFGRLTITHTIHAKRVAPQNT